MVRIDRATEADIGEISVLIGERAEYYGGQNVPGDTRQIRAMLFGAHPVATVLLARDGDAAVLGMASYTFLWPSIGTEASLYLKELFVRKSARRRGVANLLMSELRGIAAAAGCSRVEWTADTDNPAALAFYRALGVEPRADKPFYRLESPPAKPGTHP